MEKNKKEEVFKTVLGDPRLSLTAKGFYAVVTQHNECTQHVFETPGSPEEFKTSISELVKYGYAKITNETKNDTTYEFIQDINENKTVIIREEITF